MHLIVSIYTYLVDTPVLLGFNARVKSLPPPTGYRQLQRQLAQLGFLSQGSVFERDPSQQGSRYVWTRKVKGKTVTVALSKEQFHWLTKAVANQRRLEQIVAQMQTLSRQVLFEAIPGVHRRKHLSKKVLGLN
jgi:virulence-associated protein VapD